ncbi:hypothetical protein ACWD7Y_05310 [Streptomyces drozdowiczii]
MSRRTRIVFDEEGLTELMQMPVVRAALHAKAEEISQRAKSIASSEIGPEFAAEIHVSDETRPSGRPTSKVEATREDSADHEYGTTNTARRRVLGRAAGLTPQTVLPHRGEDRE